MAWSVPERQGLYDPQIRARRVRRRIRVQHRRTAVARDHPARPAGARQSDAPRRDAARTPRPATARHPHADPARVPRARVREPRHPPARARRVRRAARPSCRTDPAMRARCKSLHRAHGRRPRASTSSAGATCPCTPSTSATPRATSHAGDPPVLRRCAAAASIAAGFERKLFVIRKVVEHALRAEGVGAASTCRVCPAGPLVYKGLLLAYQVKKFYPTWPTRRSRAALALVHQRYSTNTWPTWDRAHPYRYLCHNGEINTVRGNHNWMRAREAVIRSGVWGDDLPKLLPLVNPDTLRLGHARQRARVPGALRAATCAHAIMMLIPEAWDRDPLMRDEKKALLRVPPVPDGAVGRPGVDRVLRRHADRRGARPQRPAPVALLGDQGRLRRAVVRVRRAADQPART